jgi:hypothetical protein
MGTGAQLRMEDAVRGSLPAPFGKVYTPRELAELWQLSENSIRRLFQDEPGVFTLGSNNPRGRRGYTTLRIPEEVALRVWRARGGSV